MSWSRPFMAMAMNTPQETASRSRRRVTDRRSRRCVTSRADQSNRRHRPRQVEVLRYEPYTQHHRHYKAETLEGIGPYQGLDTSAESVEPHNGYGYGDIDHKRNTERVAHKSLKHYAHDKNLTAAPSIFETKKNHARYGKSMNRNARRDNRKSTTGCACRRAAQAQTLSPSSPR